MNTDKLSRKNSKIDLADQSCSHTDQRYKGPTLKIPFFGVIPILPIDILNDLRIKHQPPLWAQFFKYGICGILSLIILVLVVQGIEFFFPQFLNKETLGQSQFQTNLTIALFCAFVPSNFFAFFSNRMFVFTPGRHTFFIEISYFTLISAISFTGGEFAKRAMVRVYADNEHIILLATLSFALSSAVVNFIARKYLIFSNTSEPNSADAVSPR